MFYFFPNLSKIIAFSSFFDQQPIKRSSHLSQQFNCGGVLPRGSCDLAPWIRIRKGPSSVSTSLKNAARGICTTSKVPKNGPCQTDANSGQNSPLANISWCNKGQKPRKMTLFKWVSRYNQTTFPRLPGGEYIETLLANEHPDFAVPRPAGGEEICLFFICTWDAPHKPPRTWRPKGTNQGLKRFQQFDVNQ